MLIINTMAKIKWELENRKSISLLISSWHCGSEPYNLLFFETDFDAQGKHTLKDTIFLFEPLTCLLLVSHRSNDSDEDESNNNHGSDDDDGRVKFLWWVENNETKHTQKKSQLVQMKHS